MDLTKGNRKGISNHLFLILPQWQRDYT